VASLISAESCDLQDRIADLWQETTASSLDRVLGAGAVLAILLALLASYAS